ncbi:MAG TPA: amidase [Marmoricola sp.]|nr:amidase [Marmoricola sp.]
MGETPDLPGEASRHPQRRVHAFTDDALGDHDAVGLVEELRAGRVSRRELVEAAIARTESLEEVLEGLACDDFDRARRRAEDEGAGFFAGVPTFVKDNADVAGLPTQQGTRAFVSRVAERHGAWAEAFLGTGLISLGKTRLSEFGFSASAEFADDEPVRNPWDTSYSSGASSAGSAVFVAAGAVPIAHANDGGGSIRIPAACNGLVGLKPSRGRTPGDRMNQQMPVRIVADGVLTRSVRDTAAFLREIDRSRRNLSLPPVGDIRSPGRKRLRIALATHSVGDRATDSDTFETVQHTGKLLESMGHHVEEVQPPVPEYFVSDFLDYWSMLAAALTAGGRRQFGPTFDPSRTDNLTRGLARHARRRLWRMPLAITRLRTLHRGLRSFYERYDVALTPVLARTTPKLGWLDPRQPYDVVIANLLDWVTFTPLQNATGDPAISLPMGADGNGMPIGVQLASSRGHEARLLELAYALEEAQPFRRIQD